jgi:hypothetical protein
MLILFSFFRIRLNITLFLELIFSINFIEKAVAEATVPNLMKCNTISLIYSYLSINQHNLKKKDRL